MKLRQAMRELRRAGWQRIRKGQTAHGIWQRGQERLLLSEHDPLCSAAIRDLKRAIAVQ